MCHVVIITEGEVIMSNQFIWAYLLNFSHGNIDDFPPGDGGRCINDRPLDFHVPTWNKVVDMLVETSAVIPL